MFIFNSQGNNPLDNLDFWYNNFWIHEEHRRTRHQYVFTTSPSESINFFFNSHSGGGVQTGSTRHVGHFWAIVPVPGGCEDGEVDGINVDRGNLSTRRKPVPAPLCPPQVPLDQTRARTRAAAARSKH
jgi:hypothetical protein